ncbi:MAG: peptide chain release factor 1 [bacterium]
MDILDKLREIKDKYSKINEQLSDADIIKDQTKYVKLGKQRSELEDVANAYDVYVKLVQQIEDNEGIIKSGEDAELSAMADEELKELKLKLKELEEDIKLLLIPKDPNDDKNVIVEIRAGTGGDEAGIFAGDLYRMYNRFAELKGWKQEVIDVSESGMGGIKEVVFNLSGTGVYADMKYESGVHRVQRVPTTEANGRVHTSAASVAILLEVEDVQVDIDPGDLRIDVYRSGGAGGQNVNKVETAIRITHIPTGLVVQCQDERSQLKNRQKALKVLKARLFDLKQQEQTDVISAQRRTMVKSGDRSDKIRTYNFPQNRVTDHRIGLTLYNLSNIIQGELFELIEKLKIADKTEKLNAEVDNFN